MSKISRSKKSSEKILLITEKHAQQNAQSAKEGQEEDASFCIIASYKQYHEECDVTHGVIEECHP